MIPGHLTDLRFCCASKMWTASEVREPNAYRDCSNRLLDDSRPSCSNRAPPDDHHAFHEDAKPGDLSFQLPIRWRSSSNQFVTTMNRSDSETLDASRSSQIHEYFQSFLPNCESQDQTTGFRHC